MLDRDSDGHVTLTELQFMLRNLGIEVKDELLQDLMKDASRAGILYLECTKSQLFNGETYSIRTCNNNEVRT